MTIQVEIRPGEGGDDAVVFARELSSAVQHICKRSGSPCLPLENSDRIQVFRVDGSSIGLYQIAGAHRVQRIPKNDTRRHTSTATIAVLESASSCL